MATAIVSLLTDTPVRPLLAMTGEITLSGNVLPVGGIKEKFLAAKRAGVRDVILPVDVRANVEEDLTPDQTEGVTIHYASRIEDVLNVALRRRHGRLSRMKSCARRFWPRSRKHCSPGWRRRARGAVTLALLVLKSSQQKRYCCAAGKLPRMNTLQVKYSLIVLKGSPAYTRTASPPGRF